MVANSGKKESAPDISLLPHSEPLLKRCQLTFVDTPPSACHAATASGVHAGIDLRFLEGSRSFFSFVGEDANQFSIVGT